MKFFTSNTANAYAILLQTKKTKQNKNLILISVFGVVFGFNGEF